MAEPHVKLDAPLPADALTPQLRIVAALLLAVILLGITVIFARRKTSARGDALILAGCSDGGKTAILSTLVYKQTLPTHTSMHTNVAQVTLSEKNKALRLIDIPGHPRIRDQLSEYMPHAKAIAFVVDASTISRNCPAVAEHLHMILHALTSLPPSRETPSLSILAHKCDLLKATASATSDQLAINRVKTILERELEKRRASQVNVVGIESLGAEESESKMSGLECSGSGEFKFAQWEGGEVAFFGTSVNVGKAAAVADEKHPGGDGLSPLREWLEDLA
ncbi:P-loop containing nucleoside triphosphate hydrolase protein [Epithele typhae]|uniref:P-loop containing nucleoside triphosphate hydrolase protein n=1 Tax=Epithele typhae TaxID=378194 RepID=UPI002008289B|nr:P-loop containing nucleoside triphosphate hydrolase protein [Epithele typhae]KAH9945895.1 P-loop containing nucleoside triphosphate hydrolase protein [Epithele typhae]